MTDDDIEYCAECGEPEFDEDGYETHLDEEEYDHDFEYKEKSVTLSDVKEGLDVLDKGIDVWNKLTRPSKIDPSQLRSDRFKDPKQTIDKYPGIEIAENPDAKAEKRHKEIMKWTKIGFIVATTLTITVIIFN